MMYAGDELYGDDITSGEVWPTEVHWSSCDGLCGEPLGCWDGDCDPENPPHDGWGNAVAF
jgi:hypothetical protein